MRYADGGGKYVDSFTAVLIDKYSIGICKRENTLESINK